MELTAVLKLIHIASAIVMIGTGVGTAFFLWHAHRSRDLRSIVVTTRAALLTEWVFTLPAVLLLPVTGAWMLDATGRDIRLPWVAASLALYTIAGLVWVPSLVLKFRMRHLAVAALRRGARVPAALGRQLRWWFALWWLILLLALTILVLMVLRPSFG